MDGWVDLHVSDRQMILHCTDNFGLMEKSLNSSKGAKRWVDWGIDRQVYGEKIWAEMVETEGKLRLSIQDDIKSRLARKFK